MQESISRVGSNWGRAPRTVRAVLGRRRHGAEKTLNPRFLQARRRAARLAAQTSAPALKIPAYVRKHLAPKVEIGIFRDPAAPIKLLPAVHLAEEFPFRGWGWPVTLLGLAGVAGLLLAGY